MKCNRCKKEIKKSEYRCFRTFYDRKRNINKLKEVCKECYEYCRSKNDY